MKLTHQLVREKSPAPRKQPPQMMPMRYATNPPPARSSLSPGRSTLMPPSHLVRTSHMDHHPQLPANASLSPLRIREVIFLQKSQQSPIRKRIIEAPQHLNPELLDALNSRFTSFEQEMKAKFSLLSSRVENLSKREQDVKQSPHWETARETPSPRWETVRERVVKEPVSDSPLRPHHLSFRKPVEQPDLQPLHYSVATVGRNRIQEVKHEQETAAKKGEGTIETGSIIRRIDSDKDLQREREHLHAEDPDSHPNTEPIHQTEPAESIQPPVTTHP